MSKKKKNQNYVTEKTIEKKAKVERAKKAKRNKKILINVITILIILAALAGGFIGIGYAFGWFDYQPKATDHVTISIEGYGDLHVELYGNDAPKTVEAFVELVLTEHYDRTWVDSVVDSNQLFIDEGDYKRTIKGEYADNGFNNKILFKEGTLYMTRADESDPNSADGAFMILTEDRRDLDGKYAAFGRVTEGFEILDMIALHMQDNPYKLGPTITSISTHAAH